MKPLELIVTPNRRTTDPAKIQEFIKRHELLDYEQAKKELFIRWLRKQFQVRCSAEVIKG